MSKRKWISFGENCLTQTLINHIGLDTEYTPFTFTRTNTDYILDFERNGYDRLKDNDNFTSRPEYYWQTSLIEEIDTGETFIGVSRVFAFGHHYDILSNKDDREKIDRRIDRMSKLKNEKIAILYHHMVDADIISYPSLEPTGNGRRPGREHILEKLNEIRNYYPNSDVLFFYRMHSDVKSISLVSSENGIYEFAINTPNKWCDDDWHGRKDYDLLLTMIKEFNKLTKDSI